ncbi:hypothetical protein [Vreelandella jeotgali]|uniref:hypothetical protein n=1 Tax=Vreelandella jeotgali TaxID=553386 RepID=UPI000345D306|nr:hypothetical protein [Halomonas jeotgali]
MAKDAQDEATPEMDYGDLYNQEDPVDSLGDLDLGDELESDRTTDEGADYGAADSGDTGGDADTADDDGDSAAEGGAEAEGQQEADAEGEDADSAEGDAGDDDAEADDDADKSTPEPDQKPKDKQPVIPKSRFDQRTAQLRAAERQLEETQSKLKEIESEKAKAEREANTLSDEQIQEKMNAANSALVEGNTEEAAKLQSEVFTAMRQGSEPAEGGQSGQQVDPDKIAADVRDQMAFEQTLESIYEEYPALNENSDNFDEAISQEAVELQAFYFQQGYTRSQSTERAVAAVTRIHDLESAKQEPAPAEKKGASKADMAKKAQQQSRREKVDKARKAPPEASSATPQQESGSQDVDVNTLTVEDWSALPDSVRSRLMGDAI